MAYTPTTDEVREAWADSQDITHGEGIDYHRAEFDRWLAVEKAKWQAEATGHIVSDPNNPYRKEGEDR